MQKSWIAIIVVLVLIVGGLFLYSASIKQTNVVVVPSASPAVSSPSTQSSQVSIQNFAFNPQIVTVKIGTKITWINNDSAAHTVTSDEAGGPLDSSDFAPGESFSVTFNQPGRFNYHCSIHSSMKGTIIIN